MKLCDERGGSKEQRRRLIHPPGYKRWMAKEPSERTKRKATQTQRQHKYTPLHPPPAASIQHGVFRTTITASNFRAYRPTFHHHCSPNKLLLKVNKLTPRGSIPQSHDFAWEADIGGLDVETFHVLDMIQQARMAREATSVMRVMRVC